MARGTNHEEERTARRAVPAVLTALMVASLLAGCADFRRQAEEAQARIASAEETAEIAVQAAADNTAQILVLEDRIETLERRLDELLEGSNEEE